MNWFIEKYDKLQSWPHSFVWPFHFLEYPPRPIIFLVIASACLLAVGWLFYRHPPTTVRQAPHKEITSENEQDKQDTEDEKRPY